MDKKRSLWTILKNYKFNSILIKNFLMTVLMLLIPLLIVINIIQKQMNHIVLQEIRTANEQSLEKTANTLDFIMNQMYSFAYYLSREQKFQYMTILEGEEQEAGYREFYKDTMRLYQQTTEYLDSIYIYLEADDLVIENQTSGKSDLYPLERMGDQSWLEIYEKLENERFLTETRAYKDFYPYYLSVVYPLKNSSRIKEGCIVLNANAKKLEKLLGYGKDCQQYLFLIDEEGKILYSNQNGEDAMLLPENLEEQEYLCSEQRSALGNWNYLLYTSMSEYDSEVSQVNQNVVNILLITLAIELIAAYILTLYSYSPILSLLKEIEQPISLEEINLGIEEENTADKDELAFISKMLQRTKIRNSSLRQENEEWSRKLKNAQMMALQIQMDPHYLYNTLDIISWDAAEQLGKDNSVSGMINSLAQFLRIGLRRSSYLSTVREEIEHVTYYTQILEKRYSESIKICWAMEEGMLDYKILRMCVQPLIENAVNHGLRAKRYEGTVTIGGRMIEDYLCIYVEDDGIGMTETQCHELNRELLENYSKECTHVGIRNVNQRLKILFGEDYGIVVTQANSGGLLVRVLMPKMQ